MTKLLLESSSPAIKRVPETCNILSPPKAITLLSWDRVRRAATSMAQRTSPCKRVVIVGGGFGGLAVARALRHARAWVMLIDRSNHLARRVIVAPVSVA